MPRQNGIKARKILLEAASDIFAQKGFRDATIAEISKRADMNIASVNYHFKSKEALYVEAWRNAFRESLIAYPFGGGISENEPAEERFRARVKSVIKKLADTNRDFWIIQKEFSNPTGLLDKVKKEEMIPYYEKGQKLLRELLGPLVSDNDLMLCEISIANLCINPMVARSTLQGKNDSEVWPLKIRDIDAYADHIANFSLMAIKAMRKNAERKIKKADK
jgi:AcrR family transcriptional regulator